MGNEKQVKDEAVLLHEAKQSGMLAADQLMAVLNVLLVKEARLAEKEANLEKQFQEKDKARRRESESYTVAKIENQKACKHLKGGKTRQRGQQRDPSVYVHTFTDRKIIIKCTLCGAKWMPKDTKDYLNRNGSAIPNWTGIGWNEAVEMAEDSSNKPSSSERFPEGYSDASGLGHGTTEESVMDKIKATPNIQI